MIVMIAAAAENNALGKDNQLVWHLPDDFKRFKQLTTGHYIIMGRKTFESFPKPLPNRTHVVITRQKGYHPAGCLVADSIGSAIALVPKNEDAFVIGGGEIYKLAMPFADKIELTRVHASFEADAFFPEINSMEWKLATDTYHPKDEKHQFDFTYETFLKTT
ncbi:dihydrofolate reductase [Flavobacterium noncentrifugens]|uniref:Dihydrofolate reductase n=1 Tax=Flavobacterium noncentrifugens TaxID=1128970 RepID=A0A1G9B029_9FLAO|nr:dihydrofolate reductase [Flavobacterium noncentrifugens]GEP51647.1 dihydrofolate reductase [Flavobacterium noncentrifugens]SDK32798.1 dihydrofolate reductase [Flavobacterium noncentrifugens]